MPALTGHLDAPSSAKTQQQHSDHRIYSNAQNITSQHVVRPVSRTMLTNTLLTSYRGRFMFLQRRQVPETPRLETTLANQVLQGLLFVYICVLERVMYSVCCFSFLNFVIQVICLWVNMCAWTVAERLRTVDKQLSFNIWTSKYSEFCIFHSTVLPTEHMNAVQSSNNALEACLT